ncbi:hypothetical protein [Hyphococcus sp.]|jgi:hypothetical protein|uniref:hypothetical protein n=1 Tax=Hyphococcus sp. TaxID=2038636 RepID=UPI003D0DD59F
MTVRFFFCFIFAGFAALTGACDQQAGSGSLKSSDGVWEMRYQDAVGQSYLNILELRQDGSYATHMQDGTPSDGGSYTISNNIIHFESAYDPRLSRDIAFTRPNASTLEMAIPGLLPVSAEWRRSELKPLFETATVNGREIPLDLPELVASALATQAIPWREDAWPTWIFVAESPIGRAKLTLTFYSRSSGDMLRLDLSKYAMRSFENDGSRFFQEPLPAQFVDLTDIMEKAKNDGVAGALNTAEMRVFGTAGPAWMLATNGPVGVTYSAQTGARLDGDVTGYIAQYESDWDKLGEIWREAMRKYEKSPDKDDPFTQEPYKSTYQKECEARIDADWVAGQCRVR